MDQIYAIVENGTVINLIMWDGDTDQWQPPTGTTAVLVSEGTFVTIGSTWDGKEFTAPATTE